MKICAFCGSPAECPHHMVFGRGLRALADEDNLVMDMCNKHHTLGDVKERIHDNPAAEALSKIAGEYKWMLDRVADEAMQEVLIEEFRGRYGRSYI